MFHVALPVILTFFYHRDSTYPENGKVKVKFSRYRPKPALGDPVG
jgi:hypothetical protein